MTVVNSHASLLGIVMANTAKALSIKVEKGQLKKGGAHVLEIKTKQDKQVTKVTAQIPRTL